MSSPQRLDNLPVKENWDEVFIRACSKLGVALVITCRMSGRWQRRSSHSVKRGRGTKTMGTGGRCSMVWIMGRDWELESPKVDCL